ncbi:helix-turn-helix domain-containing protein [Streptomyces sp. SID5643]|uniref:helix-turn-helix domain-containing protein n=1 Tax=Streptomyces sp. SID5643 TaxID=2690307 RepID=UPI00136E119D|nr:helix-turn-helix domain-containing protein [Streptomyces sp. SID5643]MZF84123.1 PucR family transcriptional regulator [Streptomyces sp. SID5643]
MKELAGRLTALDPDAGAAVRVIAYFDRLAESRAGVEALVRGAAVLAGCPARLVDPERRVQVRVEADGTRRDVDAPTDPAWPSAALSPGGAGALWLERGAPGSLPATGREVRSTDLAEPVAPSVVDAVILERAAGAVRLVLDRTRGRAPADDPALVETLLDGTAPERARLHAARRLGLDPTAPARAVAPLNGRPGVIPADAETAPLAGRTAAEAPLRPRTGRTSQAAAPHPAGVHGTASIDGAATSVASPRPDDPGSALPPQADEPTRPAAQAAPGLRTGAGTHPVTAQAAVRPRTGPSAGPATAVTGLRPAPSGPGLPAGRLGVGPAVPVLELPRSWAEARTALRFTAEGTPQDPGPQVVHAEELGGIALLADLVAPGSEPPPDVRALEAAAAKAPWLPATLHAVASTGSLRAAAAGINVHHSTLQDRLTHAEHLLGWPLRTPQGRLRLQLALAMRRLARP